MTESHRKNISLSLKGKMPKYIPDNRGRKHTLEHTRRQAESHRGKTWGRHSDKAKKKISDSTSGKKHYNWKGGKSRNKNGGQKSIRWRSKIFERDNWTCQTCGVRGCYLEAHHIKSWAKFPRFRFVLANGVTLCLPCHKLTDNYAGKNR